MKRLELKAVTRMKVMKAMSIDVRVNGRSK